MGKAQQTDRKTTCEYSAPSSKLLPLTPDITAAPLMSEYDITALLLRAYWEGEKEREIDRTRRGQKSLQLNHL